MTKAEKMMSWYRRQRRLGRCLLCRKPRAKGSRSYCGRHLLYFRLRRRHTGNFEAWREGHRGRPPIALSIGEKILPSETRETPGLRRARPESGLPIVVERRRAE